MANNDIAHLMHDNAASGCQRIKLFGGPLRFGDIHVIILGISSTALVCWSRRQYSLTSHTGLFAHAQYVIFPAYLKILTLLGFSLFATAIWLEYELRYSKVALYFYSFNYVTIFNMAVTDGIMALLLGSSIGRRAMQRAAAVGLASYALSALFVSFGGPELLGQVRSSSSPACVFCK